MKTGETNMVNRYSIGGAAETKIQRAYMSSNHPQSIKLVSETFYSSVLQEMAIPRFTPTLFTNERTSPCILKNRYINIFASVLLLR